ncbi:hypothetical protein BDC45DRAFT_572183 [Circinella umbellata]|nr:hypothetical protein BDC45DRAFT_572183 [Circinella umbellata]
MTYTTVIFASPPLNGANPSTNNEIAMVDHSIDGHSQAAGTSSTVSHPDPVVFSVPSSLRTVASSSSSSSPSSRRPLPPPQQDDLYQDNRRPSMIPATRPAPSPSPSPSPSSSTSTTSTTQSHRPKKGKARAPPSNRQPETPIEPPPIEILIKTGHSHIDISPIRHLDSSQLINSTYTQESRPSAIPVYNLYIPLTKKHCTLALCTTLMPQNQQMIGVTKHQPPAPASSGGKPGSNTDPKYDPSRSIFHCKECRKQYAYMGILEAMTVAAIEASAIGVQPKAKIAQPISSTKKIKKYATVALE